MGRKDGMVETYYKSSTKASNAVMTKVTTDPDSYYNLDASTGRGNRSVKAMDELNMVLMYLKWNFATGGGADAE